MKEISIVYEAGYGWLATAQKDGETEYDSSGPTIEESLYSLCKVLYEELEGE